MIVEFLSRREVLQVLVVCPDLYWVPGSLQEMPPLFQYVNDSEYLLVMDLIIPFHRRQEFTVEGHWVPFLFSGQLLRKNGSKDEVRTISLDVKGF